MASNTWHAFARGGVTVGLVAVGLVGLAIGAGGTRAAGPSYPLLSGAGEPEGVVEVDGFGTLTELVVTLQNARPNTTYQVWDCQMQYGGGTSCQSDVTTDSLTTDSQGNAQALLMFVGVAETDVIRVVDTGDASDVMVASTGMGQSNIVAPELPPALPTGD